MKFKIRTKLILAFFGIIFPFIIVIGIIALYNVNTIRKASLKAEAISEELHTVLSLQLAIDKSLMPGSDYIITGDKKYRDEFKNASKDVEDLIKKVEDAFAVLKGMDMPEVMEEMELLKSVRIAWQNIKEDSQRIFEIQNPVGNKEAQRLMEDMDYKWAYPVMKMLDKYHEIDRKEHAEAIEELRRAWMMAWVIMIGGAVILISFGVFFALFYSRLFTRPIQVIHNGADVIAGGNFKTRLDVKTGDEIEQLADAMNDMAAQLDSLYSSLEQKVEERTASLQSSEQKYRTLIENLQEGIWMIDRDANTSFVNPRMAHMLGYTVEEMMGRHLFTFADERGKEFASCLLERRRQGIAEQHDFEFIRKDGTRIYTTIETTPILDDAGNYAGALAGVINITERREAEEALKESEERFRNLAETTSDWVWEVNGNGVFTYSSPQIREIVGYEAKEVLGKTIFVFMRPEEGRRVAEFFRATAVTQKPFKFFENSTLHKDGHEVVVETSGMPYFSAEGKFSGYHGINRDITERKKAEEKIKEHLSYLERFQKVALKREFRMKELVVENEKLNVRITELEEKLKKAQGG